MTSYAIGTKPIPIKVKETEEQKETDKMMKWGWKMMIRNVEMEAVSLKEVCLQVQNTALAA